MFTEQTRLFWNFSYLQDLPQNSAFLPGITRNVLQHTFTCHFYLHGPCRVAVMEPLDGRVVYRTRGSASTRIQTVISRTGGSFFLRDFYLRIYGGLWVSLNWPGGDIWHRYHPEYTSLQRRRSFSVQRHHQFLDDLRTWTVLIPVPGWESDR